MGKPVRKEKKLLHPVNWMQDVSPHVLANERHSLGKLIRSHSSGKEFWFSKAVVVGSCGTHSHPPSLAITGKGRRVVQHIDGPFLEESDLSECCTIQISRTIPNSQNVSNAKSIFIWSHPCIAHVVFACRIFFIPPVLDQPILKVTNL